MSDAISLLFPLFLSRCQNTCGQNEVCQISTENGIECKCRPGFGRRGDKGSCKSKFKNGECKYKKFHQKLNASVM